MARFVPYQTGRSFIEPTKETIDGIEEAIRWAESEVPANFMKSMNELVFYMALVNQGIARKMSFGPLEATRGQSAYLGRTFIAGTSGPATPVPIWGTPSSPAAWKIPVRRISEAYYLGWKVKQIRPAVWQLYNDSREAYYIEFGINWRGAGRRVRRPIRKLSLRKTMEFMMTTQAYHRVWVDIYANPRKPHKGLGFTQIVQSPAKGSFGGPMLGRRLP